MKAHIIRVDDSEEHRDVSGFSELAKLIGSTLTDSVNLRDGRVMLVDDTGHQRISFEAQPGKFTTKARKQINIKATTLYHSVCRPGAAHVIRGDVVIVYDNEV